MLRNRLGLDHEVHQGVYESLPKAILSAKQGEDKGQLSKEQATIPKV